MMTGLLHPESSLWSPLWVLLACAMSLYRHQRTSVQPPVTPLPSGSKSTPFQQQCKVGCERRLHQADSKHTTIPPLTRPLACRSYRGLCSGWKARRLHHACPAWSTLSGRYIFEYSALHRAWCQPIAFNALQPIVLKKQQSMSAEPRL